MMSLVFQTLICVLFYPSANFGRRVLSSPMSVCLSVCPSVRLSVRLLPKACPHDNSKNILWNFTKLAHMMYLTKLKTPIDFERSRSKVKVTRGQKVKNFERPYLENYWADSLQTKTKMYSYPRAIAPCASFWISTSGLKARQGSKVKSTFSTISRELLVVSTSNKDHCLRLDELHKNGNYNILAKMHRLRDICDFA